jgi:SagB-type dehydrogenase family enzyme
MKNRDVQVGADFMQRSYYDIASLQRGRDSVNKSEEQPLPCKLYQHGAQYPLTCIPPLSLGDARWSFQAFRETRQEYPAPHPDGLDEERLSTLLYYTYGFSRHDEGPGVAWPFHRFVPSARCFFPAELYVWIPQTGQLPAGLYAYDAHHHRLALLRSGDVRGIIGAALATALEDCQGILLISALFWKTAWTYLNFAYRLCTQEVGLVVGNALLVAATLGLQAQVHLQFLDHPLNRLLGLEPEEESLMAVLPLYAWETRAPRQIQRLGRPISSQALCERMAPLELPYLKRGGLDRERCSLLIAMDQHTHLETTTEIVTQFPEDGPGCDPEEERLSPPAPAPGVVELAAALSARTSGDVDFTPERLVLAHQAFWDIMRYSLSPCICDTRPTEAVPPVRLYSIVNTVEGLAPGIYRFCAHCGRLHVVARGDLTLPIQGLQQQGNITTASASLLCVIVGDYQALSERFGNRAYRLLQIETGMVAQRLCVMSAAHGLVARYSNSYDAAGYATLLRLSHPDAVPLAELVMGAERPGSHAASRARFSLLR